VIVYNIVVTISNAYQKSNLNSSDASTFIDCFSDFLRALSRPEELDLPKI